MPPCVPDDPGAYVLVIPSDVHSWLVVAFSALAVYVYVCWVVDLKRKPPKEGGTTA